MLAGPKVPLPYTYSVIAAYCSDCKGAPWRGIRASTQPEAPEGWLSHKESRIECLNPEKYGSPGVQGRRGVGEVLFLLLLLSSLLFKNSDAVDVQYYMTFRRISEQFRILKLYTLLTIIVNLAILLVLYNIYLQLIYCLHSSLYTY